MCRIQILGEAQRTLQNPANPGAAYENGQMNLDDVKYPRTTNPSSLGMMQFVHGCAWPNPSSAPAVI